MVSGQACMLAFRRGSLSSAMFIPAPIMRLLSAALILTFSAVACSARAAPAATQVEIASGKLELHAQLYKPDGNGPFPVVIALHGCGGLSGAGEIVLPRYREWAERLLKAGYAVLWPDSF